MSASRICSVLPKNGSARGPGRSSIRRGGAASGRASEVSVLIAARVELAASGAIQEPDKEPDAVGRRWISPVVAHLTQQREHGLRVGVLGQVRIRFAQLRDQARAREAQKGVDALFLGQRG